MAKLMPITGTVLDWALSQKNLSRQDAAQRLGVSVSDVDSWISEATAPNKGQFDRLVRLLDCTPSFLFLPRPPTAPRTPKVAFRRRADSPQTEVPAETAQAIGVAERTLRVARWLAERTESEPTHTPVPQADRKDDPEEVADRLRDWLGWTVEEQTSAKTTETQTAKAMRDALQRRGVIVLHLTMDEKVARGFSLHSGDIGLIAVNTRDHVRARLFSYAHELAHLALRDDSVCLTRNDSGLEAFCNRVAAALLMPAAAFQNFVKQKLHGRVATRDNAITVRNHFGVSLQAAAIRADTLHVAAKTLLENLVTEIEPKSKGGRYDPDNIRTRPRIRVDQYGSGFVATLLDAEHSGTLRRNHVLDLLRLSDQELESARQLAVAGA